MEIPKGQIGRAFLDNRDLNEAFLVRVRMHQNTKVLHFAHSQGSKTKTWSTKTWSMMLHRRSGPYSEPT
jgi:hypothetical protein